MSRHKLFLDSPTQVGKNRITLPSALANYYGNTATAYINGRQMESKTELDGTDYKTTFVTPTPTREIEIGRGNLELTDVEPDTENRSVLSFDGVNNSTGDYVQTSSIPGFSATTAEIKLKLTDTNNQWFLEKRVGDGANQYSWQLKIYEGNFGVSLRNAADTTNVGQVNVSASTLTAGEWYHFAFSTGGTNGDNLSFYINGEEVGSDTLTGDMYTGSLPMDIGAAPWHGVDFHADIHVSEVALWNEERTQKQIQQDMCYIDKDATNLKAYYDFKEGTGTTLYDRTGNGYNGTLYNFGSTTDSGWNTMDVPVFIKTPSVLHWTPSSESGYYWVLTEDAEGNTVYVKVAGVWKEGTLYLKTGGSWVQADDVNVKSSGTWK